MHSLLVFVNILWWTQLSVSGSLANYAGQWLGIYMVLSVKRFVYSLDYYFLSASFRYSRRSLHVSHMCVANAWCGVCLLIYIYIYVHLTLGYFKAMWNTLSVCLSCSAESATKALSLALHSVPRVSPRFAYIRLWVEDGIKNMTVKSKIIQRILYWLTTTEAADNEFQPDWGCMARKFSIKFVSIEISIFRGITKIYKKSTILKISR